MPKTPFLRTFYVLCGLTVLGPLAFETFLPAVEDTAQNLKTEVSTVLLTIAIMQLGIASGQIIYGPLSDRFGRRPIVLNGLATYFVCAFLSSTIESIGPLFILRLFQGLGAACTMIIFRAVIRDLFSVTEGARLYSYLYITLSIMPLVGPLLGGFLTEVFGWRSVFVLMGGIGCIVFFVLFFFFQESLPVKDRNAISPRALCSSFTEMLRDRTFVAFLICGMGAYGGLFAILAGLAPVMMGTMQETPSVFGLQFAIVMTVHLGAAICTGKLLRLFGIKKLLLWATVISAIGGILILCLSLYGISTRFSILVPTSIFVIGFALTMAPMTAGAMSNFQHMAGRTASLLGFIHQGGGALVTFLLGIFENGTPIPMVISLAFCSLISLFALYFLVLPAPLKED